MNRNSLVRIALVSTAIIQLANVLSAQQNCGGSGSLDAEVQITGGESKNYRHCYYTVNVGNFFCPYGTILSSDCRNAGRYGVGWFGLALSVVASSEYSCGTVYFSEVTKELTFKADGAVPNADYKLKVNWSEAANSVAPARTWSTTYQVRSSATGNLSYTMKALAGRSSQGNIVSSEHQVEEAKFEPIGSSSGSANITIGGVNDTTKVGCAHQVSATVANASNDVSYRWRTQTSAWTNWSPSNWAVMNFPNIGSQWVEVEVRDNGRECTAQARKTVIVKPEVEAKVAVEEATVSDWYRVSNTYFCSIPLNLPPGTPPQQCGMSFSSTYSVTHNMSLTVSGSVPVAGLGISAGASVTSQVGVTTQYSISVPPQETWAFYAQARLTKHHGTLKKYDCSGQIGAGTFVRETVRVGQNSQNCWNYTAKRYSGD